jgi:hypothetical protein
MTKKAKRGPARPIKSPERKVGRGKPPKHAQYKKGQTGNERGRPKGSKNLTTLMMEAAHHPVTAMIGGKKRTISTLSATIMQLAKKAASGEHRATVKFLDYVDKIESRAAAARPTQYPLSEPDLEVLSAVYERMKLCEPEGSAS